MPSFGLLATLREAALSICRILLPEAIYAMNCILEGMISRAALSLSLMKIILKNE